MYTTRILRASVLPFQKCVNSVSGFANSVFYRFRFGIFRFLPFQIFKILFHFFQAVFLLSIIFVFNKVSVSAQGGMQGGRGQGVREGRQGGGRESGTEGREGGWVSGTRREAGREGGWESGTQGGKPGHKDRRRQGGMVYTLN